MRSKVPSRALFPPFRKGVGRGPLRWSLKLSNVCSQPCRLFKWTLEPGPTDKTALIEVIQKSQLLKQERKIKSPNLALVLVHDLLLAGGMQAGDGAIKQAILRHKTRLNAELNQLKIRQGAVKNSDLVQEVSINTCERLSVFHFLVSLNSWIQQRYLVTSASIQSFGLPMRLLSISWIRAFQSVILWYQGLPVFRLLYSHVSRPILRDSTSFARDNHIPDLLVFPPQISFQDDPAYIFGKIILQDKASCFPALILSPPAHDKAVVIDATAAPGNKTSHLCALMEGKGKVCSLFRSLIRTWNRC